MSRDVEKILISGAGTMGAGIALQAAHCEFPVILVEPDPAAQSRARERLQRDAQRLGDAACVSRITWFDVVPAQCDADVAIEAVPERIDLKNAVLAQFAASLSPEALIATNTSSLSVSELAQAVTHRQRFAGLHFFNPPQLMRLVEIVPGEETSDDTIARCRSLVERLQRTPVISEDTPGFIVNRVARPFYLQALHAFEEGAAPAEDLDALARGVGFRMGPFELMDLIGLDVNLATTQSVYERTGEPRFEPVLLQQQMVAQNRLGRKTGNGFYDYANGAPKHDDALPEPAADIDDVERVVVIGSGGVALELEEMLTRCYRHVELWQDDETLDQIPAQSTIVIDIGDGASDRSPEIAALDALLAPETVIFADAYATDLEKLAEKLQHPERLAGYGILASLQNQNVVEIVDARHTSDETLELAQELFESIGRRVVLLEPLPGLFLGRVVGSIVNEAVTAVAQGVASADDVDLAMRLGTNYPQGPIEWGREIGGDRVARILRRLAADEDEAFAPHRALYMLDVAEDEAQADTGADG